MNSWPILFFIAFIAGIYCSAIYIWSLQFLYSVLLLIIILLFYFFNKKRQVILWILLVLFLLVGVIRGTYSLFVSPFDISNYAGQTVTVQGLVLTEPQIYTIDDKMMSVRYQLSAEKITTSEGRQLPVSGGIIITVRQNQEILVPTLDDKVLLKGKVALLHNYNNPGSFDVVGMFKRQGITARLTSIKPESVYIQRTGKLSWKVSLFRWRKNISAAMLKVMPEVDASILSGMIFGGYTGINKNVTKAFSTTGIVHILSVSGTHIALLCGVIVWIGRRFRLPQLFTLIMACSLICIYGIICGLTSPVVRSIMMGITAMLGLAFGREKDAGRALIISGFVILAVQPSLIYDISFQLSFASTAGLIFLSDKCFDYLSFMPKWLATGIGVTLAAQLAVLPFVACYFNSFSLSSFAANIIVVPIVECIVILGLVGTVLITSIPVLGSIIFVCCSLLIGLVVILVQLISKIPGASLYMPSFTLSQGIVYYIMLIWLFSDFSKNTNFEKKKLVFGIILGVFATGIVLFNIIAVKDAEVHFIDVGQGDAALILTPHGRCVIVDTGGVVGENNSFDIGERVVVPYLKHYGVSCIDYLILTHGHQDHAGGAAGLARELKINNVMLARERPTQAVQNLLRTIKKTKIIYAQEGQMIQLDGVNINIIHAVNDLNKERSNANEVSSVIRVEYGSYSFLLTGDLESDGENDILKKSVKPVTVLKIGHHGSKNATSDEFLQAIDPQIAVISVGLDNRFGHPHPETIARLLNNQIKIYRTDIHGAIVFRTDGRKMTVVTFVNEDNLRRK